MTRPTEAAGLTAALAKSIDRRAADLTALMSDVTYRAALTAAQALILHAALNRLFLAETALRQLAAELAAQLVPLCAHCGGAVTDPTAHTCEVRRP
jgi:hypothetical protein